MKINKLSPEIFSNFRISFLLIMALSSLLNGCSSKSSQVIHDGNVSFVVIDTNESTMVDIRKKVKVCTDYLSHSLKLVTPPAITIQIYGNREKFIKALTKNGHIGHEDSKSFTHAGSPRPKNNVFLTTADTSARKICHEIVHVYFDNFLIVKSNKDRKFFPTWFDEGTAEYFSTKAFHDEDLKHAYGVMSKDRTPIFFSNLSSSQQWKKYYDDFNYKGKIYSQSHIFIRFLIADYGIERYFNIYKLSSAKDFDSHFESLFHMTPDDYFKKKDPLLASEISSCCIDTNLMKKPILE